MWTVIFVIIGIPVLCVIGYGLIDYAIIEFTKQSRKRQWEADRIRYEKEQMRMHQERLKKIDFLVPKYQSSPLTSLLITEISNIAKGKYIHRIEYCSFSQQLKIDGGSQLDMYIWDLIRLGESSRLGSLGYQIPYEDYGLHVVALLTAIAIKMGSDFKVETHCDSDNGVIDGGYILRKNLKTYRDLKSPI